MLSTVSPNTLNWLILDVRPSLHFWDDYSLFTQYNLSYIWLDLVCRYFVEVFYIDIHKEYWAVDFVLWALFLFWYLDNAGITVWVETCSLTSFTSSTGFSSSFFFFFFWRFFWQGPFIKSLVNLLQYCLFYVFVFWPWAMWDLSSLSRDQTHTPCIGRWSLHHWTAREVPYYRVFKKKKKLPTSAIDRGKKLWDVFLRLSHS